MIFAVSAAEVAFHLHDENNQHEMFFMGDDIKAQVGALQKKAVQISKLSEEQWGARTTITLPGGGAIGLYELLLAWCTPPSNRSNGFDASP